MRGWRERLVAIWPWIGLAIGLSALVLQAVLTIPASINNKMSLGGAVVFYFSFFTILCNCLAVAAYGAALAKSQTGLLQFLRSPRTLGAIAAYVATVEMNYALLLQDSWTPAGLWKVADVLLHYVCPNLFLLYWIFAVPRGHTSFRLIKGWLIFPLAYTAYILARGALTGYYPYSILDVALNGRLKTLSNVGLLLGLFVALCIVLIGLDRWLAGRRLFAAKGAE